MWGYGIADGDLSKFSNFLKNYGLNQKGELVLIDLGNLVSCSTQAAKIIEKTIETCNLIACGEKIKEHLNVSSLKTWGKLANR